MVQQYVTDISGRGREEPVIYYRRWDGWIVWGGTQASLQMAMIAKGCMPLPQYGRIAHSEDHWGPILRHPDGPAEFPLDQVLTFRWYRTDMLPDLRPIVQRGREFVREGAMPVIHFPQLKGVKITEFPCPEGCTYTAVRGGTVDRAYHSPIHLGNHLRIAHGYDRSEILKYGESMNIDFTKVPGGKQIVEYEPGTPPVARAIEEEPEYQVESVSAAAPASAEVAGEFEEGSVMAASSGPRLDCPDCGWVNEKNTQQGLNFHRKRWCKAVAVA